MYLTCPQPDVVEMSKHRFSIYAGLVRCIKLPDLHDAQRATTIITPLVKALYALPMSTPFPRLQRLDSIQLDEHSFLVILQLIMPTLTHLELNFEHPPSLPGPYWSREKDDKHVSKILRRARSLGCKLCSLSLPTCYSSGLLVERQASPPSPLLSDLHAMSMNMQLFASEGMISYLATQPTLASLTVGRGSDVAGRLRALRILGSLAAQSGVFARLKILHFEGRAEDAQALLDCLSGRLQSLELALFLNHDIEPAVSRIVNAAARFAPDLQCLSLCWFGIGHCPFRTLDHAVGQTEPDHRYQDLPWQAYASLLKCRSLRELELVHFCGIHPESNDAHLAQLATSLPLLTCLKIEPGFCMSREPANTLAGVAFLASLCPNIRKISLSGISAEVPHSKFPGNPVTTASIELELRHCLKFPESPRQVALFLLSLWPNARRLSSTLR